MARIDDQAKVPVLADATNSLSERHKARYVEKLREIQSDDPYLLPKAMFSNLLESSALPNLQYPDIYNFLIHSRSPYTHQQLKSYKSLEGYKYFVAGFVKLVHVYKNNAGVFIIIGKVVHSQRLHETALSPWVAVKPDGEAICAHCTCMAGLGESCSHISALLFAVETGVRIKEGTTCTSVPCSWLAPSTKQNVEYAEAYRVDFTSPAAKMRKMDGKPIQQTQKRKTTDSPVQVQYHQFYKSLSEAGSKSVVLSVLPQYVDNFISKGIQLDLPEPLTQLFSIDNQKLPVDELSAMAENIFKTMNVTEKQIVAVEQQTRHQSKSSTLFRHRSGRITASNFKAATRTKLENPSKSLIQKICYPESFKFSTTATRWGCEHEAMVQGQYTDLMKLQHQNLKVTSCGFFIHKDHPYIGASPDGLVSCDCCGLGVLEIKCPFCHSNNTIVEATSDRDFCLETVNGQTKLKQNHTYFYQVQCQLFVTGRPFSDFCVWTGKELFIQRILPDKEFVERMLIDAQLFYKRCVLPELLAKVFTNSIKVKPSNTSIDTTGICVCKTTDENKTIIECSAIGCSVRFFHKECMGIQQKRKGWNCTSCRVVLKRQKAREQET